MANYLTKLVDVDPNKAIKLARKLRKDYIKDTNAKLLAAITMVDAGPAARQPDAIEEGIALLREIHESHPTEDIMYNLANGLVSAAGYPPANESWLDHQESTKYIRAEARELFWNTSQKAHNPTLATQALNNLANQFSHSFRLGEAHDTWRKALEVEPTNGVAAYCIANNLNWMESFTDCSELTKIEAATYARIALKHKDVVLQFAGLNAATKMVEFAESFEEPPSRSAHQDPFLLWVEQERLTLAPTVELVNPELGMIDWLMLPGIFEQEANIGGLPPPIFGMFNMLKSDFILARDLAWRSFDNTQWPATGRFLGTNDYAYYGPNVSALILAHRTALDLLDKVAVTANHYFDLNSKPDKVTFGNLWREPNRKDKKLQPLTKKIENIIRQGVYPLYGLVELADDYSKSEGILYSQKQLRNAGTHRFVILHEYGDISEYRQAPEIEHHQIEKFTQEVTKAIRVARSAIQMLAYSIAKHESCVLKKKTDIIGTLYLNDQEL